MAWVDWMSTGNNQNFPGRLPGQPRPPAQVPRRYKRHLDVLDGFESDSEGEDTPRDLPLLPRKRRLLDNFNLLTLSDYTQAELPKTAQPKPETDYMDTSSESVVFIPDIDEFLSESDGESAGNSEGNSESADDSTDGIPETDYTDLTDTEIDVDFPLKTVWDDQRSSEGKVYKHHKHRKDKSGRRRRRKLVVPRDVLTYSCAKDSSVKGIKDYGKYYYDEYVGKYWSLIRYYDPWQVILQHYMKYLQTRAEKPVEEFVDPEVADGEMEIEPIEPSGPQMDTAGTSEGFGSSGAVPGYSLGYSGAPEVSGGSRGYDVYDEDSSMEIDG